jgi:hypothetical protein
VEGLTTMKPCKRHISILCQYTMHPWRWIGGVGRAGPSTTLNPCERHTAQALMSIQ